MHIKLWASKVSGSIETKWHLGVGPMAKHRIYYKREGGGFPKFGPWWVLWVHVYPWFVRAPKVFHMHNNQLVVWCVQVHVSNWFACQSPNPYPIAPAHPSTPKVLQAEECAPTPFPSIDFIFGLAIESIKELGGVSLGFSIFMLFV
jgi:hypothetical protein